MLCDWAGGVLVEMVQKMESCMVSATSDNFSLVPPPCLPRSTYVSHNLGLTKLHTCVCRREGWGEGRRGEGGRERGRERSGVKDTAGHIICITMY